MSGIDESEYQRLAEAVRATEKLAVDNPNIRQDAGAAFLMSAKARMGALEHESIGSESTEKKDKRYSESAAIAALVAQETRLSEKEKEAYAGLLEKDYFTKKDFKNLDAFYAASYDKLSEDGKAQMSTRIHEGIRRGEFEFGDLPERVQEKENEFQKTRSGKSHEVLSSKSSFENQPKGDSQAATVRSEAADAVENFRKAEAGVSETKTPKVENESLNSTELAGLSAFSDLPPVSKSSEQSVSPSKV